MNLDHVATKHIPTSDIYFMVMVSATYSRADSPLGEVPIVSIQSCVMAATFNYSFPGHVCTLTGK